MANKHFQKGRALERAVGLIQDAILAADPHLAGVKFSIERNKIVTVAGVRHEVDVWVETSPASDYKSVTIFECKNWLKPVGKNTVIELAEKVRCTGANRGFLVAPSFTKDAEAQARTDLRVSLLHCSEDFPSPFSFNSIHVIHEPLQLMAVLKERDGIINTEPHPLDWKSKSCFFDKKLVNFDLFVDGKVKEMLSLYESENPTMCGNHRNHYGKFTHRFFFAPQTLLIGSTDVEFLELRIQFFVNYTNLLLLSKFELKGKGRAYSFASPHEGHKWQVDIVQRITTKSP